MKGLSHFQWGEFCFPVTRIGLYICILLNFKIHTKCDFLSTTNVVNLVFTLEFNQIKIYKENPLIVNAPGSFISSLTIQGSFISDLTNIKSKITQFKPILLIRASLAFESKFRMTCYHEQLLRLIVEQLNTTLLLLGKLSSCLENLNPKLIDQISSTHPYSRRVFLLSVTQPQLETMLRDLMFAEQHVWSEAVIIYDKANSFPRFRKALETTDKLLYIRHWGKHRANNADIIKNFLRMRTFILDMSDKNVHSFFLLAAGLHLLNSMFTNIIVIDQDNVIESIRDFAFMGANITVLRPALTYNDSYGDTIINEHYSTQKKEEFSVQVSNMFNSNLRKSLTDVKVRNKINELKPDFISPLLWIDNFNTSIYDEVMMSLNKNQDYFFDFKFETVYLGESRLNKISYWTEATGFISLFKKDQKIRDRLLVEIHNKTFRVTTMEDPPFVIYRERNEHGQPVSGNDRYIGMAMDLLRSLSEMKKFKYIIHTVKDGTFGNMNDTTGEWNGMIGELINNEADMAVASLTITYDRERVIDFTTPWMSLGLSIVIKKSKSNVELLQFMAPLSTNVWLMVLAAYVAVSLTLFMVGRMTPYEWYVKHPCYNVVENQFSFLNSFWFTVGSLMQQGCDISPKATSTRMIGTIWWFFILIMVSSYTANLAAFLTIERLQTDITSIEELSRQSKVKYGTLFGGSTYSFFSNSNISTYKKMWNFMKKDRSYFVDNTAKGIQKVLEGDYAFILESTLNEYYCQRNCDLMPLGSLLDSRGYGIGLAAGNNVIRDLLSEGILRLQKEQVLEEFRRQWLLRFNLTRSCFDHNNHEPPVRNQLGLEKMGGAFFGLLIGLTVSCFVSCLEIGVWASRKVFKRRGVKICEVIDGQIKLAMCDCKRFKPPSTTSTTPNIPGSPITCNTFKAGSATVTIPCRSLRNGICSPERLYQPLPLERALLMKCNSIQNLRYSSLFDECFSANGDIPATAHKITSL